MAHPFAPYRIWIFFLLTALIVIEALWNWRNNRHVYNLKETAANLSILMGFHLSKIITTGYQLAVLGFFSSLAIVHLPSTPLVFVITFLVADFSYYWYHRLSHKVKFFWAFHLVHHSSQWMNLTTAYRLNWFSALVSPVFFIPPVLLGFPPSFLVIALALNLFYQFFMHTQAIGKIGWLEGVIDTPSAHRVHHGSNELYIDKNFGGVLMIWDRMFGTYQPETEPVKYGITTGFVGYNPFKLIFHGFTDFIKGKMNYKG